MTLPAFQRPAGKTAVLSIQSGVACGSVGNAAAVFCLRRSGHEVWPVDTVSFSNHPGHATYRGQVRSADAVAEIVDGLSDLGVLDRCRAVLGGYMGSAATARVVLDAVRRIKAANPEALYCCDPVMGDRDSGFYVPEDLATVFRDEAIAAADILMPNHFELEILTGRPLPAMSDVVEAARGLVGGGPSVVVVTSVIAAGIPEDTISTLAISGAAVFRVSTPRLPLTARGAGDALAALILGHRLDGVSLSSALTRAASSVFAVIAATAESKAPELKLVAAQDAIVDPARIFAAEEISLP